MLMIAMIEVWKNRNGSFKALCIPDEYNITPERKTPHKLVQ